MTDRLTFTERMERFQRDAPIRAAARANRSALNKIADGARFVGAVIALVVVVALIVGLIVVTVWTLGDYIVSAEWCRSTDTTC